MKRRILLILIALLLLPGSLTACRKAPSGSLTVRDAAGNTLARITADTDLTGEDLGAYLQITMTETAQLLAQMEGIPAQTALEKLLTRDLTVTTAFDRQVFDALLAAPALTEVAQQVGCAITNTRGDLLAVYSYGDKNYAATPTPPYSSLKPLSVYLPAIESGALTWFTTIEDSPHHYVPDDKGGTEPWPRNNNDTYSREPVMLCDALAQSLNTVAVKTLERVGVENSMTFLKDKLGIALTEETYVLEHYTADELLGSIALGYLETGVSAVDMAGYYQIFATGGRYFEPRAVTQITDAQQQTLYTREYTMTQVASSQAADIMNRMLQEVTKGKGTGTAAKIPGVEVSGKTGTGDDHSGNWFVGLIPGYSCAVWHGQAETNRAAELFGQIMAGVFEASQAKKTQFNANDVLTRVICCTESGMPVSPGCTDIREGYLLPGQVTQPCNIHN